MGSAIYAKSCNPEELAEGAIITFSLGSATELVEVHRVVQNDTQKREIITKGDANAQPDVTPVAYGRVTGEVLFSIPLLGAVSTALHSVGGIAVCIAIFALACLLWAFADKIKTVSYTHLDVYKRQAVHHADPEQRLPPPEQRHQLELPV